MKRNLHWILLAALLLVFAFVAVVWSAAAALPDTGVHLYRAAKREAPLTYAYMLAGRPLRTIAALRDYGDAYANDAFARLASEIRTKPEVAIELAFGPAQGARHGTLKLAHYAPIVLFLAWVAAYLMRPKAVHLVRRR